jgi:1-acyl-sn-glycerol-3-phosphate acyltransferase
MLPRGVVSFFEIIAYTVARVVFWNRIRHANRQYLIKTKKNRPRLIISNHQSGFDAIMVTAALPPSTFFQLLPIAYMTKNKYLAHWWQKLYALPLGMFPAHKEPGRPAGLELAQTYVKQGRTIYMFPEGQWTEKGRARPKKGAAVLASKNRMTVMPVQIDWKKYGSVTRANIIYRPWICLWGSSNMDTYAGHLMNLVYRTNGVDITTKATH